MLCLLFLHLDDDFWDQDRFHRRSPHGCNEYNSVWVSQDFESYIISSCCPCTPVSRAQLHVQVPPVVSVPISSKILIPLKLAPVPLNCLELCTANRYRYAVLTPTISTAEVLKNRYQYRSNAGAYSYTSVFFGRGGGYRSFTQCSSLAENLFSPWHTYAL